MRLQAIAIGFGGKSCGKKSENIRGGRRSSSCLNWQSNCSRSTLRLNLSKATNKISLKYIK